MAPTDTGSPGADTPDFRTAAVRDKGITPATLDPRTPCLGILTDGQCDACVLRVSPMDYEGYFPAVQLIVPDLVEQNIGGAVVRSCRNRRTDGAHRHAALGALAEGSVCTHADTVRERTEPGKPLGCGASDFHSARTVGVR